MTAEPPAPRPRAADVHLFLLAGQHPGMTHTAALHAATRYTLAAERAGYAGVWLAEHHFIPYGVCPSALTFAAHLLGRTERITVGTAAAMLSNRHPVTLGEETALLHELTGGRFTLGVARGGPWVDLEVFGTGLDRYQHGFGEALDLLLDWLSGREQVGADGEHFRFRPVTVVPRPAQPPPVWIAATSPGTVEHAARRGQPLLLGMHTTDAQSAALIEHYTRTAARHGHDPGDVPHASVRLAHIANTDESAATTVRRHFPALLAGTRRYVRIDGSQPAQQDLDAYTEHLIGVGAIGSADTCRDRLTAHLAATGVHHLLLMVEAAGVPDAVEQNLTMLAQALNLGRGVGPVDAMPVTASGHGVAGPDQMSSYSVPTSE